MNTFARIDVETFFRFAAEHPEQRYELERGLIVQQMTGGTFNHGRVARRISQLIEGQINPARWCILQDRGVAVGRSARYPDVVVEPVGAAGDSLATKQPAIIVEVLSPSTTATDVDTKRGEYLAIQTLDAYLVASQDEPAMLVWTRNAKGKFAKAGRVIRGADKTIVINGRDLALKLKLADVYKEIA